MRIKAKQISNKKIPSEIYHSTPQIQQEHLSFVYHRGERKRYQPKPVSISRTSPALLPHQRRAVSDRPSPSYPHPLLQLPRGKLMKRPAEKSSPVIYKQTLSSRPVPAPKKGGETERGRGGDKRGQWVKVVHPGASAQGQRRPNRP